ncbi:MAG: saccharopine dehydrogenase family protein [Acidimicrobiales bacterium]
MTGPAHDLIVFGATSFAGQILCRHLVDRHGVDGPFRWAMAGRNEAKLDRVAAETGADVPRIVADSSDRAAMDALCASSRVVVSTVGPYALHGSPLVAAAAANGTDYCDITGEPHWMRSMIDEHQAVAAGSGSRIVHACGFDSIPSDLGVAFTQAQAVERFGAPCTSIGMRVKAMKGGASGGTVATMVNVVGEVRGDPSLRSVLTNPYALAPEGQRKGVRQPNVSKPQRDALSDTWVAPFLMASVNTRVVHRSHALSGRPWGEAFTYDEAMMTGEGPLGAARAAALTGGIGGFIGLASVGPVRSLLEKHVLPKPGDGPDPAEQEAGFYDLRFFGRTDDGETITVKVTGDRDPGYGSTAKMLGEAAVAIASLPKGEPAGGFWTPATALGLPFVDRLEAHAGLTFSVID